MQAEPAWREARQTFTLAAREGSAAEALRTARELLGFERATDVAFCATAFRKMSGKLVGYGHRPVKVFLVRSVTLEPILPSLHVEAALHGFVLDIEVGGYGSYMHELLDGPGALGRSGAELVCVLLDVEEIAGQLPGQCASGNAEAIEAEIGSSAARVAQMLQAYRSHGGGRLVVQGCVLPGATSLGPVGDANLPNSLHDALRRLNLQLRDVCRAIPDCAFFDADAVASQFGRTRWRDERLFLSSRLAVAPAAFRSYARALVRTGSALLRPPRKVLCTDLDNTLWGGILGEDGAAGIATGSAFPGNSYLAYQRFLKELATRGILLAMTSKNNEADVVEAFRLRGADLALTLDDFVARKIGWQEKAEALRALAAELSLGLDAFVFVDDNPVECAAIRQQLPEVAVVEVPVDEPWRLVSQLSEEWFFDVAAVTADDRHRSDEYRAQAQRAVLSEGAGSREVFLGSLGIVCTVLSAADAPLDRAVQLLAKTNQFNLTTRRHSATEVMAFVEDPLAQALALRVRDRFGDAGVVGLALTRQLGDHCWIDTLLLSCRVIGRGIESALLAVIAEKAKRTGARWIVGEYIETRKNIPCKDFYPDHGFAGFTGVARPKEVPEQGVVVYELDLAQRMPEVPAWLTLEGNERYELAASIAVSA